MSVKVPCGLHSIHMYINFTPDQSNVYLHIINRDITVYVC